MRYFHTHSSSSRSVGDLVEASWNEKEEDQRDERETDRVEFSLTFNESTGEDLELLSSLDDCRRKQEEGKGERLS